MHFIRRMSVRFCTMLFLFSLLWLLCGAPLTQPQWASIPSALRRTFAQIPYRMQYIFRQWHTSSLVFSSAEAEGSDDGIILTLWDAAHAQSMEISLENYVFGVVAAEMPAVYNLEALKAQAVAARTKAVYACRRNGGNGCGTHPLSDICTEAACCQAYMNNSELKARWVTEYEQYAFRIRQAVQATRGQILTYDGLPIQVLYHACSGGMTEDAAEVFSQSLPYLVSVASPGEEFSSAYIHDVSYTLEEAASLLRSAFPASGITADGLAGQLRLQSTTPSGRISSILVGNTTVTGSDFRNALNLQSTLVSWTITDDSVTFHTRGYGHGVGMSQAGANAMASEKHDYPEILSHYYPGTCLSSIQ